MPAPLAFLPWLYGFIVAAIPSIIATIVKAVGISVISYVGFTALFDEVQSRILTNFDGISSDVIVLAGLSGFGVVIKMILSAYTALLAIKIFTSSFTSLKIGGKK